jgi:putative radical SAM enzyme (TIGR03279 family)
LISDVLPGSPACRAKIKAGETLLSINGHRIHDVLDYRFYMTERRLLLEIESGEKRRRLRLQKGEYEELGLEFATYLMDRQHSCKNKCIFCFVDQTPPGMRESLYFKDDDERLSFLFGSYITLTNLCEEEVERILKMHISPINVSVHTMNPELRIKMMKNPSAGRVLSYLRKMADAGISINAQLVLCPGINDGEELCYSLDQLFTLRPALRSVAAVPVGLTRYREGLCPLRGYTPEEAREVISCIDRYAARWEQECGERVVYPSDEFFLLAGLPLPGPDYYGDYPQLENGVGLCTLLEDEFNDALETAPAAIPPRAVSCATGAAAFPLIERLAARAMAQVKGLTVRVYRIENDFWGHSVTVAGLITGQDLTGQLKGKPLGEELLIPQTMLRHERDRFLDDMTLLKAQLLLSLPIKTVENDGYALLESMLGAPLLAEPE